MARAGRVFPTRGISKPHPFGHNVTAYELDVLADSPSLYWRMNNATRAWDYSGYGRDGTTVGSPSTTTGALLNGDSDLALSLDGSTQYVTTSYSPFSGSALTFESWVYRTNTSARHSVFGSDAGADANAFQMAFQSGNTNLDFFPNYTGGGSTFTTTGVTTGAWHYLALVFDDTGNTATLYVDGLSISQQACTNTWSSPGNLSLGTYKSTFLNKFLGYIDEVAIYPTALSLSRIQSHYTTAGYTIAGATANRILMMV